MRLVSGNLTDNVYGVGSTTGKGSERGGEGASVPPRSCPWCRQHPHFHRRSQTFSWTRWSTWTSKAVLCSRAGYLMHWRRQRDGHETPCWTEADRKQRSTSRLAAYRLHLQQKYETQCDNFRLWVRVSIWDLYNGDEEKIGFHHHALRKEKGHLILACPRKRDQMEGVECLSADPEFFRSADAPSSNTMHLRPRLCSRYARPFTPSFGVGRSVLGLKLTYICHI